MANILIIEDSPSQSMALQRIVEKIGHTPIVAMDGEAGLEMAESQNPDLVLMDIIMPLVNGFQATRKLSANEKTKHIPVVIISTKDQDIDKAWGLRQGAKAYLTKPFKEAELVGIIKKLLPNS